ncbi:MAG: PAS domain S-box protein [Bacillota bacterium]
MNDQNNAREYLTGKLKQIGAEKDKSKISIYREIFDASSDTIIISDKDTGEILDINRTVHEMYGYNPDEFCRLCSVVISGKNPYFTRVEALSLFKKASEEGSLLFERLSRKKDGSFFWAEIDMKPVTIGDYAVIMSTIRDITKQKRAEAALQEQLHFLQLLINTIPYPVFFKDAKGLYKGCNKAFEEFLDLPREKIVGKTVYEVSPKELAEKYFEMDNKLFNNPGVQIYESEYYPSPNVKRRNILLNKATYLNTEGKVAGLVGIIIDITERKETEAALRNSERFLNSIFESILDPFTIIDRDFNIIRVNSKTEELFKNSLPIIGKKCYEIFHYSSEVCEGCPSVLTLTTGQASSAIISKKGPNGQDRGLEEHYSYPFIDMSTNQLNGVIIYVRDITAKIRVEQEMARLERLSLIGEMAAGIGHEVRNPMTTVRGFLQLLGSKKECALYREFYELMIEELDRANSIITEFLSLAKNKPVDLAPTSLNSVINTLLPLIQADATNLDMIIKTKLEDTPAILLDEKEIRQLILNLVRNGLEAMPPGGSLTIKTSTNSKEVTLSVEDRGEGISSKNLHKLGTPFFTTKDKGTGLGLAVCYSIAARHNATINVETGPAGTTFFVKFNNVIYY